MNVIASAGHHVQESTSPRDPFACRFFRPALNEALKALDTLSGKEIAEVKAWQKALVVWKLWNWMLLLILINNGY